MGDGVTQERTGPTPVVYPVSPVYEAFLLLSLLTLLLSDPKSGPLVSVDLSAPRLSS